MLYAYLRITDITRNGEDCKKDDKIIFSITANKQSSFKNWGFTPKMIIIAAKRSVILTLFEYVKFLHYSKKWQSSLMISRSLLTCW